MANQSQYRKKLIKDLKEYLPHLGGAVVGGIGGSLLGGDSTAGKAAGGLTGATLGLLAMEFAKRQMGGENISTPTSPAALQDTKEDNSLPILPAVGVGGVGIGGLALNKRWKRLQDELRKDHIRRSNVARNITPKSAQLENTMRRLLRSAN